MKYGSSILTALVFAVAFAGVSPAQKHSRCSIGSTHFPCPEYFKEVKVSDPTTRLYKYTEKGNNLFFFTSVPQHSFDPAKVGELVLTSYRQLRNERLKWKPVNDPFVMSTDTKHKYQLVAAMGLGSSLFLEVKAFLFEVGGKKFVLGYVSDWSENEVTNRRRFEVGKGFADNAAGCNAVVTALNSVTQEFKTPKQYCFFSVLGAPK